MKTRVALVLSYFPTRLHPHRGMQFLQEARALAKMAEVAVFVALPEYPRLGWLQPRRFAHRAADVPQALPGARVEHVTYPAVPVLSRLVNGAVCGARLLERMREFRPDVVLSYQVYPEGYAALYAAKALGVPCVSGAIGSDVRRSGWLVRKLVRRVLRGSSLVLAVCEELRERAIRMGVPPARARTVMNGCDAAVFHPMNRQSARRELNLPPDSRLIVFTGNLVPVKGLPDLLRALALLQQQGSEARLALVGDGPLAPRLKEMSRTLGIADRVHFAGSEPPARVAAWLGAADLFCLPSHSEGSPNAMVEALCCGRPVVASNVGGIPELINPRSGILSPPRDPAALARCLSAALERSWDEAGIARMYRRSWDDMARETLDACLEAAGCAAIPEVL